MHGGASMNMCAGLRITSSTGSQIGLRPVTTGKARAHSPPKACGFVAPAAPSRLHRGRVVERPAAIGQNLDIVYSVVPSRDASALRTASGSTDVGPWPGIEASSVVQLLFQPADRRPLERRSGSEERATLGVREILAEF